MSYKLFNANKKCIYGKTKVIRSKGHLSIRETEERMKCKNWNFY